MYFHGCWPFSGAVSETGGGRACKLPVPARFCDSELETVMRQVVLPLANHLAPDAVVVTCGADALDGDPLSSMALTNVALWSAVERVAAFAPAAVVLGGGGYNPWTVARYWTGLWGRLSGRIFPAVLPESALAVLAGLKCDLIDDEDVRREWFDTLADPPRGGKVRLEIDELCAQALAQTSNAYWNRDGEYELA